MRKLAELIRERAKLDQELEQFKHLLTIQLVDIVASSELYRRMDLLTAAVMVERELNRIKAKVIHFGGLPIKTIGDALLSRFEDPVAGVRDADLGAGCTVSALLKAMWGFPLSIGGHEPRTPPAGGCSCGTAGWWSNYWATG